MTPVNLQDITIKPTTSTKYLGVMLDQHLKWAPQVAQACEKGSKWSLQIRRLTKPTWGLSSRGARKLYVSVALPQILYGIDIGCTPTHGKSAKGKKKGSVNTIKKLVTVQRAGSLAVMGGFRTSPTDSLDTHAALLPIELRVKKACFNLISRMATLPHEHPLHSLVKRSTKGCIKRHRSPINTLTNIFRINSTDFEKIPPVRIHPSKRGSCETHIDIPPSKKESKRADTSAIEKIKVYTDGSAHSGKVGAAAILRQ